MHCVRKEKQIATKHTVSVSMPVPWYIEDYLMAPTLDVQQRVADNALMAKIKL